MSADTTIALDVTAANEVWLRSDRLCPRSESPQRNAGKALRALGVPGSTVVHFRRFGRICRAVVLERLLMEFSPS
jgi:hypothetical protein